MTKHYPATFLSAFRFAICMQHTWLHPTARLYYFYILFIYYIISIFYLSISIDTCLSLGVCASSRENWMNSCIWEHLMVNTIEVWGYCYHLKCVLEYVTMIDAYALEQCRKRCFLLSVGALWFFRLVICTLFAASEIHSQLVNRFHALVKVNNACKTPLVCS